MEAVLTRIEKAGMFLTFADQTMDSPFMEQMSIFIRLFAIDELQVCEEVLGFYHWDNT